MNLNKHVLCQTQDVCLIHVDEVEGVFNYRTAEIVETFLWPFKNIAITDLTYITDSHNKFGSSESSTLSHNTNELMTQLNILILLHIHIQLGSLSNHREIFSHFHSASVCIQKQFP